MTQPSKTLIPAADITADLLRSTDLDTIAVVTPGGRVIGQTPSLAFGLGSWDGDYEGFAAWLVGVGRAEQVSAPAPATTTVTPAVPAVPAKGKGSTKN
jgi:hypothetical protein